MPNAILHAIRAHAAALPQRTALVGDAVELSYAALARHVDALAHWLRSHGVRRAALCGDNGPAWIIADLAARSAGVVLVPVPVFFSAAQRDHVLRSSGVEHLIACGGIALPEAAAEVVDAPVDGIRLATIPGAVPVALPPGTCKITFTSGTTGTPKGVCLDAPMLEAVTTALAERIHAAPGMRDAVQSHFTLLPLSTLLENVAGCYVPLLLGKQIIVRSGTQSGLLGSSRLDLPQLLRCLHRDRPNSLILLPQILRGLVMAAEQGVALPDSLRFVAVGGATTPASLILRARVLGLPVYEGYGLSECASVVALNAPGSDRAGSVGRPLAHVRVRVVDGAIEVAGNVFSGYLGAAREPGDQWLATGDLGHLDADGFLYVTGRRKHVLITGFGRNVSPEWVEAELTLDPVVAQAMVVGEAEAFLAAIVVPAAGAGADAVRRAVAAANARLPDYARVHRVHIAPAAFTTANGLLTDNGRLRRDLIAAHHAAALRTLFDASSNANEPELVHELL